MSISDDINDLALGVEELPTKRRKSKKYVMRMPDGYLTCDQVSEAIGVSRSTFYTLIKNRKFPPPVELGDRRSAWLQSDVDAHLARLVRERNEKWKGYQEDEA